MFYSIRDIEQFFIQRQSLGIKPGLDRVHTLLKNMGHPEKNIKGIHFAGTNGKGSTMQMVQDALMAHHYRVGVFTSPSFTGITGYMFINGQAITEKDLLKLFRKLLSYIHILDEQGQQPTEFEILTVIAFMYFQQETDIVLIETGMGGRFDTTNCFIPLISVITSIAYDHMDYLGHTIKEIAYHKAGIMKQNRPAVIGKVDLEARKVLMEEASRLSVPYYEFSSQFRLENDQVTILEKKLIFDITDLSLDGHHQKENAAIALMTLTLLADFDMELQWKLVLTTIKKTTLPGRLETIHQHPTIILDSAHNVAGVEVLREYITQMETSVQKHLLFAGFADKQLDVMFEKLHTLFDHITMTSFDHRRAATKEDYDKQQLASCTFTENWQEEVKQMISNQTETIYFITGSLHFITMVRQFILQQKS